MVANTRINSTINKMQFYPQIGMFFVGLLLTANVIGEKPIVFSVFTIPAGLLIFPLTYLLGALLTEVYGFAASRKVIWFALICSLFMGVTSKIIIMLPADPSWPRAEAYNSVLGSSSKIMILSALTYFIGEFTNAYLVTSLRKYTEGRFFWARALCGSWIGEALETAIFIPSIYYGLMDNSRILYLATCYYIFKVIYVLLCMPLVNYAVKFLKEVEYQSISTLAPTKKPKSKQSILHLDVDGVYSIH